MSSPQTRDVDAIDVAALDLERDRLVSIAEAADYLSVSRPTIHRMVIAGTLTQYRIAGGRNMNRFRLRDLEALIDPVDTAAGSTLHPVDIANGATAHHNASARRRSKCPVCSRLTTSAVVVPPTGKAAAK